MDNIPTIADVMDEKQARELNPLVLAYIGDAVHTLYVRTKEMRNSTCKADKLHILVTAQVKAQAQARHVEIIRPLFEEDEEDIFLRARNSRQHSVAKNASIADYKAASGWEAVIGYLYLCGRHERLDFLLSYSPVAKD